MVYPGKIYIYMRAICLNLDKGEDTVSISGPDQLWAFQKSHASLVISAQEKFRYSRYGRYQDLIEKYQRSVNVMVNDSFPR